MAIGWGFPSKWFLCRGDLCWPVPEVDGFSVPTKLGGGRMDGESPERMSFTCIDLPHCDGVKMKTGE